MPVQVNCRVQRSDYLEVGETTAYKGVKNASVQIVNTRSGECMGIVITKEDAIKLATELTQIFNIKSLQNEQ